MSGIVWYADNARVAFREPPGGGVLYCTGGGGGSGEPCDRPVVALVVIEGTYVLGRLASGWTGAATCADERHAAHVVAQLTEAIEWARS